MNVSRPASISGTLAGESESKSDFFIVYCYETIIFQYAIVTDKVGQPKDYELGPRPRAQACG